MRKKFLSILTITLAFALVFMMRGCGENETDAEEAALSVDSVVQMEEAAAVKAVKAGVSVTLGKVTDNGEEGGIRIKTDSAEYVLKDVSADAWYVQAVNYAVCGGLMDGIIGEDSFSPDRGITRAQFAVILHRFLGGEPEAGESSFTTGPKDSSRISSSISSPGS